MKTLYILRHAKSDWTDFSQSDFDRTLNTRGECDAPKMGEFLAKKGIKLDRIIASPAVRAKTTALYAAKGLGYEAERIIFEPNLYLAELKAIRYLVQNQPDTVETLMIVGHNPGLTEAVNALSQVQMDELPTAGVFAVQFSTEKWGQISRENSKFLFFESPKTIEVYQ